MGFIGVLLHLLVAFSLIQGGCRAGPIVNQSNTHRNLKTSERFVSRNAAYSARLHTRRAQLHSISPEFQLRPIAPGMNNSSSMWAVTAVVGIILLLCLLAVVIVIIRRAKKRRQKAATDEELGFGQHLKMQPDLAQLPRTYDGMQVLRSPPTKPVEEPKGSGNIRKPIPLPLLIVSSPEELISKPRRVPVPRLPPISSSSRIINLPPSPRLVGLPPSPQPPASPRTPSPILKSQDLSEPERDIIVRSSPRGLHSPSTPAIDGGHALEVPLSAGGLERMITRMEKELREDT